MRILTIILLSCTFIMCKTKSAIPTDQLLTYVVILEKEATPKVLKNDISFELLNFKKEDEKLNQWVLNYNEDLAEGKKIKTALLNHPMVVSAFTRDQFEKFNLKKGQKSGAGSLGKLKDAKQ